MPDMEPFTLVEESRRPSSGSGRPGFLFDNVVRLSSAQTADHDLQYIQTLRNANPQMIVTGIPAYNVPLLNFAAAGFATYERDTETDSFAGWRGYSAPSLRQNKGRLAETVQFAKYHYKWGQEDFIVYVVDKVQYVLKERRGEENEYGPSAATDALIQSAGDWLLSDEEVVWVFDDGYWRRDKPLYLEVEKASWDQVILDEDMKNELTSVATSFFDGKDVYADLGVPWKRGLMFHGPPGNGKTISIKALMHTLLTRKSPVPTLYVKSAPWTYNIQEVFRQARALSPCMLILEDIETIVTPDTRSYFFNEMDGLSNNDGLFIVASTNYLEKLDPGLTSRPSRFDRKYLFPVPNEHERFLYCEFWRAKLAKNPKVLFPKILSPAMAAITPDFSFAFLQECFVASLLVLARDEVDSIARHGYDRRARDHNNDDDEKLYEYALWVVFQEQAETLRKEIRNEALRPAPSTAAQNSSRHPQDFNAFMAQLGNPRLENQAQVQPFINNKPDTPKAAAAEHTPQSSDENLTTSRGPRRKLPLQSERRQATEEEKTYLRRFKKQNALDSSNKSPQTPQAPQGPSKPEIPEGARLVSPEEMSSLRRKGPPQPSNLTTFGGLDLGGQNIWSRSLEGVERRQRGNQLMPQLQPQQGLAQRNAGAGAGAGAGAPLQQPMEMEVELLPELGMGKRLFLNSAAMDNRLP